MGSVRSSTIRSAIGKESNEAVGALEVDVHDATMESMLGKAVPKRQGIFCGLGLRETVMMLIILLLSVIVAGLSLTQKPKELPPYCLFAIGGGYLNGTAFPQEDRLKSEECNTAIRAYLTNGRYQQDVESVVKDAIDLLKSVNSPNASQVLVFDIDETVLSNMKEFEHMKFGKKPYDIRWTKEWQLNGTAPALKPMLGLYKEAFDLGFSVTFLTGRHEEVRGATESNLKNEGFGVQCKANRSGHMDDKGNPAPCYVRLDVRENGDNRAASVYKPERRGFLQDDGYTLLASFGDQWSDLTGPNLAKANFKLPNPMYYLL